MENKSKLRIIHLMNPLILVILDGWGWSRERMGNAILAAKTPNLDFIRSRFPFFLLQASGAAVGLPPLKEGNSETGHLAIGSGRVVMQHLSMIDQALKNGSFFENQTFLRLLEHLRSNGSRLHLMGLLTSGTVHASFEHLRGLVKFFKRRPELKVFLHLFTDGKDSGKKESELLLETLEKELAPAPSNIRIVSLVGRDMAMDRDNNWRLTQDAYDLIAKGIGERTDDLKGSLRRYHTRDILDELVPPTILTDNSQQTTNDFLIRDGDGVLFFNFREDSVRQLTRAFTEKDFEFFGTVKFNDLFFATMTDYGRGLAVNPIFKKQETKNTLAEALERNGKKQLHVAESWKYAHVTYFFNGLNEEKLDNETDILIPSFGDYRDKPQMKAAEITDIVVQNLKRKSYDFILVNFANPDMLAHTGDFRITVKGIEAVDEMLGRIYDAASESGASILITSDHGNAESLTYQGTGEKESRHNLNPVPLYLVAPGSKEKTGNEAVSEEKEVKGMLQDVAPTILDIMNIQKPQEMTGESLMNL